MHKIAVIPGDGVGKEVIPPAIDLIEQLIDFERVDLQVGYETYKRTGKSLSEDTIDQLNNVDAIFFGAVTTPPNIEGYQSPILQIRRKFDLYANIRPIKSIVNISRSSDIDFVIIRENTEGLYSGIERSDGETAITERIITKKAVNRILNFSLNYMSNNSRSKLTLVHKANVLRETDGLFLHEFHKMMNNSQDKGISYDDKLVDSIALQLISMPEIFDTIVTSNMFGDILSDLATYHIGGLGMASSANIGDRLGLFEPVHGSAPDIAGKGIANPYGSIFCLVSLLQYINEDKSADILDHVLMDCFTAQVFTNDIGGSFSTHEVYESLSDRISKYL